MNQLRFATSGLVAAVVSAAWPALAQLAPEPVAPEPPPPALEAAAAPERPAMRVSYDGGTLFSSQDGRFEVRLGGRMQTRYELQRSFADGADFAQRFRLPRARLNLDGRVFGDAVRFKVEGSLSDDGNVRLRDFFLDVTLPGGAAVLRAGQFKRPYNRQEIVSDFATELPEKASTNDFAQGGRDIGIMLHDGFDRSPDGVEWAIGLFNGQGDRARITCAVNGSTATCAPPSNVPADFEPQLVARLGVNVGGIKGYSEGDLEGGPLRFAAAVAYRLIGLADSAAAPRAHAVEIDMLLKASGLSLQAAGFLHKRQDADALFAGHVQAGYFLTPKHAQIDARFAVTPLPLVAGASQEYRMEIRGGFNYYFQGHSLKWSNDVGVLQDTTSGAEPTLEVRSQAQLIF